jgi:demethylmenaquinone methyltransferase/2-methoxy-6-polyprenyl-1,4-benzoquinol methylase
MSQVKPYTAEGSKKEQIGQMFDNIAQTYDGLNRFLSLGVDQIWRRRLMAAVKADRPQKVLDMATGTGDVALALGKHLSHARITGVDLSAGMLAVGKKKVAAADLADRIEMIQGDSENLSLESESYDAATVAFGVRNFENLQVGLSELCRVLKPGASLHVLEFSRPRVFPVKQIFHAYFRYVLPVVGRLTSRDARAYTYLYESVQVFPEGDDFLQVLRQSGFSEVHCSRLTFGICSLYLARK